MSFAVRTSGRTSLHQRQRRRRRETDRSYDLVIIVALCFVAFVAQSNSLANNSNREIGGEKIDLSSEEVIALSQYRYELRKQLQVEPKLVCRMFISKSCSIVHSIWHSCDSLDSGSSNRLRLLKQLRDSLNERKWRENTTNELARFLDNCMDLLGEKELLGRLDREQSILSESMDKILTQSNSQIGSKVSQLKNDQCSESKFEAIELRHNLTEFESENSMLKRRVDELEQVIRLLKESDASKQSSERNILALQLDYERKLADLDDKLAVTRQISNDWKRMAQSSGQKARTFFETQRIVAKSLNECKKERAEMERRCAK